MTRRLKRRYEEIHHTAPVSLNGTAMLRSKRTQHQPKKPAWVCQQLCWLQSVEELAPLDQHLEKEHQEKTKVKNIQVCVEFPGSGYSVPCQHGL